MGKWTLVSALATYAFHTFLLCCATSCRGADGTGPKCRQGFSFYSGKTLRKKNNVQAKKYDQAPLYRGSIRVVGQKWIPAKKWKNITPTSSDTTSSVHVQRPATMRSEMKNVFGRWSAYGVFRAIHTHHDSRLPCSECEKQKGKCKLAKT